MTAFLTREQALALGQPVSIDLVKSAELSPGQRCSCQVNSGTVVRNNPGSLYCMGFVAGSREEYEPHAWVKLDGIYLECSPQDGIGHKYILVKELTYADILQAVRNAGFNDRQGFIPPLLDNSGNLTFLRPDDDANLVK